MTGRVKPNLACKNKKQISYFLSVFLILHRKVSPKEKLSAYLPSSASSIQIVFSISPKAVV